MRNGNSGTAIRNCGCSNAFQDARYGPGRRVANATKDGHRCTSCGQAIARQAKPVAAMA
jgi:hypothetical protein